MTSNTNFNNVTGAKEVAVALRDSIRSRTVVITGVNPHGLGAATAHAVASQDPSLLILTYRTREKVDKVIAELKDAHPSVATRTLHLDLADTDSIRQAAKELDSIADHVDVLINNAGVMSVQNRTLTTSGIEMHFATNHIGHFLFTNLIMDKLLVGAKKAAKPGVTRVINLSGGWHQFSPVRFNDINFEGKEIPDDQRPDRGYLAKFGHETEDVYIPEVAYAQSKTANILFSVYLTEHLSKFGILSFALNPGGILTEIARHLPQETVDRLLAMGLVDKTDDQGSATTIVAAFDPALTVETEPYFHDCQPLAPKDYAKEKVLAERLWHVSEDLVGEKFFLSTR